VLFGAHALWLHPWFVAAAWWRLYGFPVDPRLYAAFWLHDIGYLGCSDMDGPDGESHVELGARVMQVLFGREWGDFCRRHSRYWVKTHGGELSALAAADKLAFAITPWWLYIPMTAATGELREYMAVSQQRQAGDNSFTEAERESLASGNRRRWLSALQAYTVWWVRQHVSAPASQAVPQTSN
jgi:hypothetical protein